MQQHFSNLEKITVYIRKPILLQGNYHLKKQEHYYNVFSMSH